MSNTSLGRKGEDIAERFLKKQGWRILEKNFRSPLGEIDLIAQDGPVICFVEVKSRRCLRQGEPYEAVGPWKIRKLSQMAAQYLKYKFHTIDVPARFDVISIIENPPGSFSLRHLQNAFDAVS